MDDGAKSLEESVAMLRMAAGAGTTDIVATPHADLQYRFQPDLIEERIAGLEREIGSLPRIHRGCDFHLVFDNIQEALANPARYTIDHRRYLLVEFSEMAIFANTTEIFDRMLAAGMVPVITHPERNPLLRQRIPILQEWAGMGCLLQVTSGSLLGGFGRKAEEFCDVLMRHGLVHVVASDAHDTRFRTPDLRPAREHVVKHYGEEIATFLFEANPRAIVDGEPLPPPPDAPPAPKKWYRFWS
jgi:protein-tyrosine phosphatase